MRQPRWIRWSLEDALFNLLVEEHPKLEFTVLYGDDDDCNDIVKIGTWFKINGVELSRECTIYNDRYLTLVNNYSERLEMVQNLGRLAMRDYILNYTKAKDDSLGK
jgi:hypothetical protein